MNIEEENNLRQDISRLIFSGEFLKAKVLLASLFKKKGPSVATFVISTFEKISQEMNLTPFRIAILRSFTVEPLVSILRATAYIHGIDLFVHVGAFNTYSQEILDEESALYKFKPDLVILAVRTCDITQELWRNFSDFSPTEISEEIGRVSKNFGNLLNVFRSRCQANFILHTLEMPSTPTKGILDFQSEASQVASIQRINEKLNILARSIKGVYLLDYDGLVARHGRRNWHDESKWLTMRMPIAANHLMDMVNEWMRFIHPLSGRVCKVLVTDLDNTLWGGVIGEDEMKGIKLGTEYPGAFYLEMQRVILNLKKRGVILAVASKNNHSDAMEAIEKHPGMLLRSKDFASLKINWKDKAQNLREIAKELNLGLDSIAFMDDNPVECQLVRSQLPDVKVIDLPEDPAHYADTLRDCPYFERLSLSNEDQERSRHYAGQRMRLELKESASSLEDFFWSLDMEVEIFLLDEESLPRAAQLTQKTNQFNMTTRRLSEQQLIEISLNPNKRVYLLRLRDRFGDSGIVGESITCDIKGAREIETFLLSCRALSRSIETAFLGTIAEDSHREGISRLIGSFIPTEKNSPAKDFYQSHGFNLFQEMDGMFLWEFDLKKGGILLPKWIKRRVNLDRPSSMNYIKALASRSEKNG